jgi:HD-GYP domain-containing protein (c-di-GMP phosphodiesterase class II)
LRFGGDYKNMKKTIKLESAYDYLGSILTEPVIFRSFELVPSGTKLTWDLINRLHDIKSEVPFLYIDDLDIPKKEVKTLSTYTMNELYSKVRSLMSYYSYDTLEDVDVVAEIIESTIVGLRNSVNFDLDAYLLKFNDIYSHTLNTTVVATLLAIKSGQFSNWIIQQLALGSLLHDIGYIKLMEKYNVDSIFDLTPEQQMEHPVVGYELVVNDEYISDMAKKIILMHHFWCHPEESFDADKGYYLSYPSRYKDKEIPVWSKSLSVSIVHVASDFEHFINTTEPDRISKKAAIKKILAGREIIYGDAALLLANYISPYSVGDKVKLSNGRIGEVVAMTPLANCPVVLVNNKEIDLAKNKMITISDVVN